MAAPTNAVDRLLEKVGNNLARTGDPIIADYGIVWVNEAQREVCNRANFWFMSSVTELSLVQSDTEVALPSDFKDEDAVWIKEDSPGGYTELYPMEIEDHRRFHDHDTESEPREYRIDGSNELIIRPIPDKAYTLKLDYWAYLADLVAAGASNDLVDNYSGILEAGATYRGFRRLGEFEDAQAWKQIFEEDVRNLKVANAERVLPDEFIIKARPDALGSTNRRIKGRR